MPKPRCYIASPFGFSEAGRHYYKHVYLPALAEHVEVVDPWTLTTGDEVARAAAEGRAKEFNRVIGQRNMEAIRGSDICIAHLDGQEIDSGTAAEVGYAVGRGLICYGIRSDFRQAGERGAKVNLQVETLILESGGFIAPSLGALVSWIIANP